MAAGLFIAEIAIVGDNVVRTSWRMTYLPEDLQGRVGAAMQTLAFAAMPPAGICAGWLAESIGNRTAFIIMLSVHVLAVLSLLVSPIGYPEFASQNTSSCGCSVRRNGISSGNRSSQ